MATYGLPAWEGGKIEKDSFVRGHCSTDLGWEGGLPGTLYLGSPLARSIIIILYYILNFLI